MMSKIMIAGIGTEVGKTVVSAIIATLLKGDYWKPVQCGDEEGSDTALMKKWLGSEHTIFNPAYSLKAPLSPHHAACLENVFIDEKQIHLPQTLRPLIIEGVGGVLVPLNDKTLSIDVFKHWDCKWIIVSKHYLGSINHTLLTLEYLKQQKFPLLGIIFNGSPNLESETVILQTSQLPCLGRLKNETYIDRKIIQRYAGQWQSQFIKHLL